MPLLASNRVGVEREDDAEIAFYGGSFITDETGAVVRQMGRAEEGFACATFDLDAIAESRRNWGVVRDRRPEMYGIIASHGRDCP